MIFHFDLLLNKIFRESKKFGPYILQTCFISWFSRLLLIKRCRYFFIIFFITLHIEKFLIISIIMSAF